MNPNPNTHIIRVHAVNGVVYARYMAHTDFDFGQGPVYAVDGQAPVPAGLTQQGVVDHFRSQGWTVEQDHGTDFDNPQWGE